MASLETTDVAIDVRGSTVEASGASKLMNSISPGDPGAQDDVSRRC
jgi:hypothetical protein